MWSTTTAFLLRSSYCSGPLPLLFLFRPGDSRAKLHTHNLTPISSIVYWLNSASQGTSYGIESCRTFDQRQHHVNCTVRGSVINPGDGACPFERFRQSLNRCGWENRLWGSDRLESLGSKSSKGSGSPTGHNWWGPQDQHLDSEWGAGGKECRATPEN